MSRFMTPEEVAYKKERNKRLFYISIPIFGCLIGIIIALLSNYI